MLHALRAQMAIHQNLLPMLEGIVEVDEKYLGGKPRFQHGVKHKRGHGTAKACIATAVERQGPVKAHMIANNSVADLRPFVESAVAPSAHLMSDEHSAYRVIGRSFAAHDSVNHGQKEFARGDVHSNTAESFHATLERAKQGVYHYMSPEHLPLYTAEAAFRWNQRTPETRVIRKGKKQGQTKTVMKRLPILEQFKALLKLALCCQLRRTENCGIRVVPMPLPLFGL
jgi:hypothetical protein